ncbi:L-threonylcarbamoyladenylate synthase [Desulfotomaculum copahuensis]|uniref:Threonylcarbamoyl-AMP synthase n=1 Tax=Desulfotomaculum copahuensis TaxID=1838280 RepID=A0A1B7LB61_9FIRM|nr:L-threonylcarbamoyladenylate synthase [Desulfotomaculum copahuensis]OAT79772.1 threonylcarbamoyl-AMP synthase [Desulfotomaculum copahuensis]
MQKTRRTAFWPVDSRHPDPAVINRAGLILRRGGLVAFPTETVYGLGANALDGPAVAGIFRAKGRPRDNPLIVHVAAQDAVYQLAAAVPDSARRLMQAFWPGPLTLVLPAGPGLPPEVTAGLDSVGLRMPAHPVALALISAAGVPVAAPSANLSGRPSPTTAGHVWQDLRGRIDAVLDGGPAGVGVESTVLDMTGPVPVVLRPGGVTPAELTAVAGEIALDPGVIDTGAAAAGGGRRPPRSPGMKYRHYAPRAPLILVEGAPERVPPRIRELAEHYRAAGKRVGILACAESADLFSSGQVLVAGRRAEPATVAARLFASLRRFDELGVDVILAEGVEPQGVGLAVMNRLRRAAGDRIERV